MSKKFRIHLLYLIGHFNGVVTGGLIALGDTKIAVLTGIASVVSLGVAYQKMQEL